MGCEAVWKDKPYYGQKCRCCFGNNSHSCRCRRNGPFKFPGTLIKSSPNPQYIPGIASPTPTAVSSPTFDDAAYLPLTIPGGTTAACRKLWGDPQSRCGGNADGTAEDYLRKRLRL